MNKTGLKALNTGLHNGTIWFEPGSGFVGRSTRKPTETNIANEVVQLGYELDAGLLNYLAKHPTPDTW